jgi:hypothetical protein
VPIIGAARCAHSTASASLATDAPTFASADASIIGVATWTNLSQSTSAAAMAAELIEGSPALSRPAAPEGDMPNAHSRIVIGRKCSFIYIEYCPLCGLEHVHGQYPLHGPYNNPVEAYEACDGHRASHCDAEGLGRVMRRIDGEWCNVSRDPPPEYHEPKGGSYRLVMSYPACFTPRGIRSKAARDLMNALAKKGFPTSLEILKPRRKFVLRWGG